MAPSHLTLLKALAVEPRAKIVSLLSSRSLCVAALARLLQITPGAVSQHLNVLKDSGLVTGERRGYFIHYRITQDAQERARNALDALFDKAAGLPHKRSQYMKACSCPRHKDNSGKRQNHDILRQNRD